MLTVMVAVGCLNLFLFAPQVDHHHGTGLRKPLPIHKVLQEFQKRHSRPSSFIDNSTLTDFQLARYQRGHPQQSSKTNLVPPVPNHALDDMNDPTKPLPPQANHGRHLPRHKHVIPSFYYKIPPRFQNVSTNLWTEDPDIPDWMKAYLDWHSYQRTVWKNEKDYTQSRWLVMQCIAELDPIKCGGTADRLKPMLYLMRVAYESKRILLIRWTRPAVLESFLIPPQGGIDWRVPDWMMPILANETNGRRFVPSKMIEKHAHDQNLPLVRSRYQSFDGGSLLYNQRLAPQELTFDDVFYKVWRIFFRPSPPIASRIETELGDLVPGEYTAAHVRALYAIPERPITHIRLWTHNALNCASNLRPGMPIYFASDSSDALPIAREYALRQGAVLQGLYPSPNPPLHLDSCPDWADHPVSDFYDTFVDLYLLALAGCTVVNKGGFGHWAMLIGGNVDCFFHQHTHAFGSIGKACAWTNDGQERTPGVKIPMLELPGQKKGSLWLDPME